VLPPRTPRDNTPPFTLWVTMGSQKEVTIMLWTMFVVLIVMWLLGMVTGYSAGGIIHILLVLAVISLALQLITRRRLT
jgi:predicted ferric reductase